MSKYPNNDTMFAAVRALELPLGQYAIAASGPLGVRDMRQIGDIDLIVTEKLWDQLVSRFGMVTNGGNNTIEIAPDIEASCAISYPNPDPAAPTVEEQIRSADIILGLPFVSLRHTLFFKESINRQKDQLDITMIREFLMKEQNSA